MKKRIYLLFAVIFISIQPTFAQKMIVENAWSEAGLVAATGVAEQPGKRACAVFNRSADRIITVRIEESVMINDHLEKRVRAIEKIGPRDRKFVGYAGCDADVLGERCIGFRILVAYYDDASRMKTTHSTSRTSSVSTPYRVNGVANAAPVRPRNI